MYQSNQGYVRPYSSALVELNRVGDGLWIILCFWYSCRFFDVIWSREHLILSILAVGVFTLSASFNRLYRSWRTASLFSELMGMWVSWMFTILLVVFAISIYDPVFLFSNSVLFHWFAVTPLVFAFTRTAVRLVLRKLRILGRNTRTAAIMGATDIGQQIAQNIDQAPWMGIKLVGVFDARKDSADRPLAAKPFPVNGTMEDLVTRAENGQVDMIYITLPMRSELRIKNFVDRLINTTVTIYFVPDLSAFELLHSSWDSLGGVPVVSIVDTPFEGLGRFVKRVEDIILASVILVIIAVPLAIIAISIKLTSKGPIIYRQNRYGLAGEKFVIWKFRTLNTCDDDASFSQVNANDHRITPLGAFLRRTSLDELPQFINVLQGRMSIVGPRPHPVPLDEQHRHLVRRYMLRHKVPPGITGWAQVNGYRGETDTVEKMQKRIEFDLAYIHNWSLGFDLKIIFRTIWGGFRETNVLPAPLEREKLSP